MNKNKVILGLSGGVDSAAAALVLRNRGFEVTGLYFDISKHNKEGIEAARKAAHDAGIGFVTVNVHEMFSEIVIDNFCREYIRGRTPNPCIICNPAIKFKALTDFADSEGAQYIATGHYAKTVYSEEFKSWFIQQSRNAGKDQSYMLYRLSQNVISRLIMPLEDFESKNDVREFAQAEGLFNASKKDSQEICFIDDNSGYIEFIRSKGYNPVEGNYVDMQGNVLGRHEGIANYTVGQRKGLGIALGKPAYVISIDDANNSVVLGDSGDLFRSRVYIGNCFFPMTGNGEMPDMLRGLRVMCKIRYAAKPASAVIERAYDDMVCVSFDEPQRAPAPGQSLVIYSDGMVIGGGFIELSE